MQGQGCEVDFQYFIEGGFNVTVVFQSIQTEDHCGMQTANPPTPTWSHPT
jgi:hypothetical protein